MEKRSRCTMATKREKELQDMSNGELLREFRHITIKTVHEENSVRGMTKKSAKDEKLIIQEMSNRFDFEPEELEV